jgi:hypothetical protein
MRRETTGINGSTYISCQLAALLLLYYCFTSCFTTALGFTTALSTYISCQLSPCIPPTMIFLVSANVCGDFCGTFPHAVARRIRLYMCPHTAWCWRHYSLLQLCCSCCSCCSSVAVTEPPNSTERVAGRDVTAGAVAARRGCVRDAWRVCRGIKKKWGKKTDRRGSGAGA